MDKQWDAFVIYVNAYSALQEAYDSSRRNWEPPTPGLDAFCRDANPFVWDERGSVEPELYEGFCTRFDERFPKGMCSATDGRLLAREWLLALEGPLYGTHLASSLDDIAPEYVWCESCEPVARQISMRAARLARSPQDEPLPEDAPSIASSHTLSASDIEAVIELLSHGDANFAATLRARLTDDAPPA